MSLENEKNELVPTEDTASETVETTVQNDDPFSALANPTVRERKDVTLSHSAKKKILWCVLAGIAVIVCVVIALLIWVFPEKEDDTLPTEDPAIVVLDKSKDSTLTIASANLQLQDGTVLNFYNKDGALILKQYEKFDMSVVNMDALIDVLSTFTATTDLGEQENLSQYGFDKPTATGAVTYTDNTTYKFVLGAQTPDKKGQYFREDGKNHVYILSTDDTLFMTQLPLDYVSTAVMSAPELDKNVDTSAEIVMRNMTLSGSLRKNMPFTFRMVTSEDSDAYMYYNYIITSPYVKGVDSNVSSSVQSFTSLTAEAVVAVNPTAADLQEYGLDDPTTIAAFTLACRTTEKAGTGDDEDTVTKYSNLQDHVIKLGKLAGAQYYVMIDDKPVVYLVAEKNLPFATWEYDDLADTMLFLEDITNITAFKVETPDKTTLFNLKHNPDDDNNETNLTVTAGDKTCDTMDFRHLMQVYMRISRYTSLKTDVAGKPLQMTMSVYLNGKSTPSLTVKFYQMSSNLSAAILSNGEKYQVRTSEIDNVLKQTQNLLDGKTVLY